MDKFIVTNVMAKLGYYVIGGGTTILGALLGAIMMKSVMGFIGGMFLGLVFAIPGLLACEFSYAIVKIAENTKPENQPRSEERKVA